VVAVVPVPVQVVRDPESDGLVVAPAQLRQELRIEGGSPPASAASTAWWASRRTSMMLTAYDCRLLRPSLAATAGAAGLFRPLIRRHLLTTLN
jgi:hypothetical protein